jgi:hypothetical protein
MAGAAATTQRVASKGMMRNMTAVPLVRANGLFEFG